MALPLCLACLLAAPGAPAELRLMGEASGPGLIVALPVVAEGQRWAAFAVHEGTATALPSQWDPDLRDAPLAFWLPAGAKLSQVRLRPQSVPAAPAADLPTLRVKLAGEVVEIDNESYRAWHDPNYQAGLLAKAELQPGGPLLDSFLLNDRVYSSDQKRGFYLRHDTKPIVTVLAAGPLRAVVQVTARYLDEAGQAPQGSPKAVYTYTYLAGSPRVDVTAELAQSGGAWDELHFQEINFAKPTLSSWRTSQSRDLRAWAGDERVVTDPAWAALVQDRAVLGLSAPGGVRVYDGVGGYGAYLHGPWLDWRTPTTTSRAVLYLTGQSPSDATALEAAMMSDNRPVWTAIDGRLAEAIERLGRPDGSVDLRLRHRRQWYAALARQLAVVTDVTRAAALVAAAEGLATASGDSLERSLQAVATATGLHLLASTDLGVAVDGSKLLSLFDFAAEKERIGIVQTPWEIEVADGHDSAMAEPPTPTSARTDSGRTTLTIEYEQRTPAGPLATRLWLQVDGSRLAARLRVQKGSAAAFKRVDFPVLSLAPTSATLAADRLLSPNGPGVVSEGPLEHAFERHMAYPSGWCTMQFLAQYGDQGGVYLAAEDPVASTKTFHIVPVSEQGAIRYAIEWPAADLGRPGAGWETSGSIAIERLDGDWYDAALRYRAWAEREAGWWPTRAKPRKTPQRVRDVVVWAQASGAPGEPEKVVERVIGMQQWLGVPMGLHWYNWHEIPFDTYYPHYKPAKAGFPEGVAALKRAGVLVMPYINARLWDTGLEDFAQAKASATVKADGTPYIEEYGSGAKLAPMCPTTPLWQKTVNDTVRWLQDDCGVDGVYLDQIAAAAPVLCMNPVHGHPLGGGHWWTTQGYWPLLEQVRAGMPASKFVTTECNAEPYLHLMDGYLTWHWQEQSMVPAFSAVYSDQIEMFGRAYAGGPTEDQANTAKTGQALVFGEQLGWVDPSIENKPSGQFFKACAQLRAKTMEYLSGGRMLRPPVLAGAVPKVTSDWQWNGERIITMDAVQVGAWRHRGAASTALLLVNISREPVAVRYTIDTAALGFGPGRELELTQLTATNASDGAVVRDGQVIELTVPAATPLAEVFKER